MLKPNRRNLEGNTVVVLLQNCPRAVVGTSYFPMAGCEPSQGKLPSCVRNVLVRRHNGSDQCHPEYPRVPGTLCEAQKLEVSEQR